MEKEKNRRNGDIPGSRTRESSHEESSTRVLEPWIQRVRIRSVAINLLLRMVADKTYSDWDNRVKTFKRPFRCFVRFQSRMQEGLQALKEYLKCHAIENEGNGASTKTSPSEGLQATGSDSPQDGAEFVKDLDTESISIAHIAKLPGAVDQIECYIKFVEGRILPFHNGFDQARVAPSTQVRYEDLWHVFRVGDLLYTPKKNVSQWQNHDIATAQSIWRIFDVVIPGDKRPGLNAGLFTIECYYVDHDGTEFGAVTTTFDLKSYDGERHVSSLPFYPLRFASNSAQLMEHALSAGERFVTSINNPNRYASYSGWTVIHNPLGTPALDDLGELIRTPEHMSSEIVIDIQEGLNHCPRWMPRIIQRFDPISPVCTSLSKGDMSYSTWHNSKRSRRLAQLFEEVISSDGISDVDYNAYIQRDKYLCRKTDEADRRPAPEGDDLALLPRRIIGYALWKRKFVLLDVHYLRLAPANDEDNPFDKLQIEAIHKTMIQSITSSHFVRKELEKKGIDLGTQDIIKNKGKGVVILLHGVPGVGKTATAEAVAQKWKRPLFPITCGDLGSTAESVEKSLNEILRLAHLWDCVLLLDEADVFIAERTKSDLQRNALVSVFLRMLEYYNGILFLTTNRPGVIDEAVKSRVHLSLLYDALNLDQTRAIFMQNIAQLQAIERKRAAALKEAEMDIFEKEILSFVEEQWSSHTSDVGRWNGRQIRNAFSIAASLA
ncbi:hypothetical protein M406DRAFT_45563, partial [Cryphonectria parasitica EP155]